MKEFLTKRKRVFVILTPAFLGMLYMGLCVFNMRQSIQLNESFNLYLTRFDFGKIWNLATASIHPPLYYFMLKIWAHLFGHVDYAMRMMSSVFGALAILFAFLWLKYKYGLRAAILASFLLSISPILIRYGQEMTMYTMVLAIVFAATYFLQLAIDNGKKIWWVIYAILVAAGMWTHYFTIFAWCAHLVYLFKIYGRKALSKKEIWATYLLPLVIFLPWVPSLLSQINGTELKSLQIGSVSATTIMDYFLEAFAYMKGNEVQNWILVLVIAVIAIILFLSIRYRKKITIPSIMALIPLILLVLFSLPPLNPIFIPRGVIYATLSIPLMAGIGLTMLTNKPSNNKTSSLRRPAVMGLAFTSVLVASSIVGIATVYSKGNYDTSMGTKPTNRDLYNAIVDLDNDNFLPIVCDSAWLYYSLSAYTSESHPILFINEQTKYDRSLLEPLKQSYFGRIDDLDDWLSVNDEFWYVGIAPNKESDEAYIGFPRDGWRIAEVSNMRFDDRGDEYQILKLTRDESYNND